MASYCFLVALQLSHNRLVAGSNPAGATKFTDENHALKPPFRVAFLLAAEHKSCRDTHFSEYSQSLARLTHIFRVVSRRLLASDPREK